MQKKSEDFSEVMRLAKSPAGQELIRMLQQSDPDAVRKAMAKAGSGDYSGAARSIEGLMTPEIKKLLKQLGG